MDVERADTETSRAEPLKERALEAAPTSCLAKHHGRELTIITNKNETTTPIYDRNESLGLDSLPSFIYENVVIPSRSYDTVTSRSASAANDIDSIEDRLVDAALSCLEPGLECRGHSNGD